MNKDTSIKLIDVSHTIENGLITYKGLPAPIICDYLSQRLPENLWLGPRNIK